MPPLPFAHIGLRAICLLVSDTLRTNLLPKIGLCAILTGGRRDLPFCLTLGPQHSQPTLLPETGLRAMENDDDTDNVHRRQ